MAKENEASKSGRPFDLNLPPTADSTTRGHEALAEDDNSSRSNFLRSEIQRRNQQIERLRAEIESLQRQLNSNKDNQMSKTAPREEARQGENIRLDLIPVSTQTSDTTNNIRGVPMHAEGEAEDPYQWHKNGQTKLGDQTRIRYRCSNYGGAGCKAYKSVTLHGQLVVKTTYTGNHNHPPAATGMLHQRVREVATNVSGRDLQEILTAIFQDPEFNAALRTIIRAIKDNVNNCN